MDPRLPCIRRKLAKVPHAALRSHSFGEEEHRFRLTPGRVVTGNGDGCWGPDVSSAADFLAWYERWLDHLLDGRDNRALELTSPGLRRRPAAP
ncbi:hypothetical protein [Streptomyces sp. NRRL B-3253]|uniref:hypothetical protein n=1 Tax=Streptomyces sp. NRRL B-3253 TaxID=1463837 RepID=UPI0004CDA186|nr:hypothetical protein [Streptomyces sp. NRRL B-3253]